MSRRARRPWALLVAYGVFVLFLAIILALLLTGATPLDGRSIALLLLCGGFIVAGAGPLVLAWRGGTREGSPLFAQALLFAGVLLGLALWAAAPLALLGDGYGWGDWVGSPGKRIPVWLLAAIAWATFGVALVGSAVALIRAVRARRSGR